MSHTSEVPQAAARCDSPISFRRSLLLALPFATASLITSWLCSAQLAEPLIDPIQYDVWFDADPPYIYSKMSSRWSPAHEQHGRRHPLFSLFTTPVFWLLHRFTGLSFLTLVRICLAALSFGMTCLMMHFFAFITESYLAASVWMLLYLFSAAHLFWFGIPETFPFAALTMILPLLVFCVQSGSRWQYPLAVATTFLAAAITITNGMSGALCTIFSLPFRRAWEAAKSVVCLLVVGATVQAVVIPIARGVWFAPDVSDELNWVRLWREEPRHQRPFLVVASGVVVPEASVRAEPLHGMPRKGLTVQTARYNATGLLGCAAWVVLLSLAIWVGVARQTRLFGAFASIAGVVLAQLVLHTIWGHETFLYCLHYTPMLLLLSAFAYRSRYRKLVMAMAGCVLLAEILNNPRVFLSCVEYVKMGSS